MSLQLGNRLSSLLDHCLLSSDDRLVRELGTERPASFVRYVRRPQFTPTSRWFHQDLPLYSKKYETRWRAMYSANRCSRCTVDVGFQLFAPVETTGVRKKKNRKLHSHCKEGDT